MSHPKSLIINKSTEDLLNELEVSQEDKLTVIDQDTVYTFLRNNKIQSGSIKILKASLYTLYSKTILSPISKFSFYNLANSYLEHNNKNYLINKDLNTIITENKSSIASAATISGMRLKQFERFLKEYDIEEGNEVFIECKALYYFFDEWCYKNKISIGYKIFNKLCNAYLTGPEYLTKEPHYGTTRKFSEKINEDQIKKAKEWAKKFKSSKPSKVSSPKS